MLEMLSSGRNVRDVQLEVEMVEKFSLIGMCDVELDRNVRC